METDHTIKNNDTKQFYEGIQLTAEQKAKAFEVVEKVFEVFTEAVNDMMAYAEKHPIEEQLSKSA